MNTLPLDNHQFATPAGGRVYLSRLRLTDFRNYADLSLELDERPVVLTGDNGAGKTNLLEAVSLLAPGRGLRGAPFAELARFNGSGLWAVSALLQGLDGEVSIGTGLSLAPGSGTTGRAVKIDGHAARGTALLGDHVQIVWLTPAFDGLFTGPASERRAFLDRLIAGLDPSYRSLAGHYERAMRQRNKLLEMDSRDGAEFAGLEMQMAESGAALAAARLVATDRLARAVADKWGPRPEAPFPWSLLAIDGTLETDLRVMPSSDAEDRFLAQLRDNREIDRAARRALIGPHRADLLVTHGPKQLAARYCSTGEQKALLTGLVLAYAELLAEVRGAAPLILLDEISAHFDATRRAALFGEIVRLRSQAFMTGTDQSVFAPFGAAAQYYSLGNGAIIG
jgi:DNA replication and repair protein RecF